MIRRDRWPTVAVAVVVGLAVLAGMVDAVQSARRSVAEAAGPAPAFEALGQDGSIVRLEDYDGRVVLIDFFATWCAPCEQTMPLLATVVRTHAERGVVFLAASVDEDEPGRDDLIRGFFRRIQIEPPRVVFPSSGTVARYRAQRLPHTVIVDREGQMTVLGPGAYSEVQLRARLEEALAPAPITDGG